MRFNIPWFLAFFLAALPAGAGEVSPRAVVEAFHESLLAVMKKADELGMQGRYRHLEPRIDEAFDLARMIRVASGSHWRKADPAKRRQLLGAFRRMSVSSYAAQFDGYSGQSFVTVGERKEPKNIHLVETRILSPGEEPVDITYVTKNSGDGWRIVDVLLDNAISELAVRRSEYRRILIIRGVDGLIAALNRKAATLQAE